MASPEVEAFRENVANLCAERGDIQRIADGASLSRVFLSRVIHGHTVPTIETAAKIAESLGVPLAKLLRSGGKNNFRRPA